MSDYVIVGAGSAGCVLAARLTEDPDVTVTLIEAGPPDTREAIHVPAMFPKLVRTEVDWDYTTMPEPRCNDRGLYLPRGKMLGGSSSINAMVYIRGNRLDYDTWAADGAEGWSYDDLLPYFLRSEDNERGADAWHATGGPLAVSEPRSNNAMCQAFVEAAVAAGHAPNPDFNGAEQDGVGWYQVTQRNGQRCSTSVAYLHPAMDRPNLTIESYALASRIVLEGGVAVGVAFTRLGEETIVPAEREVLLCGGAYNSPQLLMLSGIGPAETLTPYEIDVALDQPAVGANLQDHPTVGLVYATDEPESLLNGATPEALEQYTTTGTGPLASNLAEAGGFVRTRAELDAPDIQFHAIPALFHETVVDPPEHGLFISACLLKPESRGSVSIASAEPSAKAVIRHNYYEDERDMQTILEGVRAALEITEGDALSPFTTRSYATPDGDDETALRAHVAAQTQTLYHPVGTCAIGTVVDTELRVNGVDGLRVCDASVMPTVVRGNTNAPVIAIAERTADLLRGRTPAVGAAPAPV